MSRNCLRPTLNRELRLLLFAAVVLSLAATPSQAVMRRAFVTSVSGTGDLSSWPGASGATALERGDSICRARAAAGGLPNAASYRVWLSTSATDAYCHVQGLSGQKSTGCNGANLPGGGPWYLANGISSFTGTLDELTGPEAVIYRPVMLDEYQNEIAGTEADRQCWTGTYPSGTAHALNCSDWTLSSSALLGRVGDSLASAGEWTHQASMACGQARRLLCLEPGPSQTTPPRWTSAGVLVFVTSTSGPGELGSWPEASSSTGIAAGHQICRTLAAQAGLPSPGAFVAWLSTNTVDARDLIPESGPYKRPDGFPIAGDLLDLTDGSIGNSIHVTEEGRYLSSGSTRVWTGTLGNGMAASADHCDNWTGWVVSGKVGDAPSARTDNWTDLGPSGFQCSTYLRLYCFSTLTTVFWDGFEAGTKERWRY